MRATNASSTRSGRDGLNTRRAVLIGPIRRRSRATGPGGGGGTGWGM